MSLANPKRGTILTLLVICLILIHLGGLTSRFIYLMITVFALNDQPVIYPLYSDCLHRMKPKSLRETSRRKSTTKSSRNPWRWE